MSLHFYPSDVQIKQIQLIVVDTIFGIAAHYVSQYLMGFGTIKNI